MILRATPHNDRPRLIHSIPTDPVGTPRAYFTLRAQQYCQLAVETGDSRLKTAYEAIAADMSAKVATANRNRQIFLMDGLAVGTVKRQH
jgi:hypothetical protein